MNIEDKKRVLLKVFFIPRTCVRKVHLINLCVSPFQIISSKNINVLFFKPVAPKQDYYWKEKKNFSKNNNSFVRISLTGLKYGFGLKKKPLQHVQCTAILWAAFILMRNRVLKMYNLIKHLFETKSSLRRCKCWSGLNKNLKRWDELLNLKKPSHTFTCNLSTLPLWMCDHLSDYRIRSRNAYC